MNAVKNRKIWVSTSFIGFHKWVDAPEKIAYLRDLHRHKFNVKVFVDVTHDDREVEFHMLQDYLRLCIPPQYDIYTSSCEDIATQIYTKLVNLGNNRLSRALSTREVVIEVDEDGECGAVMHFSPRVL